MQHLRSRPFVVRILASVLFASSMAMASDDSAKTINIQISAQIHDGNHRAAILKAFQLYEAQHPGITIQLVTGRDSLSYAENVESWMHQKAGPNIVHWYGGRRISQFLNNDQLHDLSTIWNNTQWSDKFPKAITDSVTLNEKQYGIPITYYVWGLYYSKHTLREFGIQAPATWNELISTCKALRKKGIDTFAYGLKKDIWTTFTWFDYFMLRVEGKEFYGELTAGNIPYSDARVQNAFTYWKELLDNNCFNDNLQAYSLWQAFPRVLHGLSAFSLIEGIPQRGTPTSIKRDIRFAPFPSINPSIPQYTVAPSNVFIVPSYHELTPEVKQVLTHLGSQSFQSAYNLPLGRPPARIDATDSFSGLTKLMVEEGVQSPGIIQSLDRESDISFAKFVPAILADFHDHRDVGIVTSELEALRLRVFHRKSSH